MSIDILDNNILKKSYYGLHLKFDRDAFKQKLYDPLTEVSFAFPMKKYEELLKKQQTECSITSKTAEEYETICETK